MFSLSLDLCRLRLGFDSDLRKVRFGSQCEQGGDDRIKLRVINVVTRVNLHNSGGAREGEIFPERNRLSVGHEAKGEESDFLLLLGNLGNVETRSKASIRSNKCLDSSCGFEGFAKILEKNI